MFIVYDTPPIPSDVEVSSQNLGRPQKTWFFQKEDKSIVALQEAEAWRLYSGKNQMIGLRRPRTEIIGVGSGEIYHKAVVEAVQIAKQVGAESGKEAGVKAGQEHIRKGYAAEIEAAMGHIERPRNFDMVDRYGNPTTLQDLTR